MNHAKFFNQALMLTGAQPGALKIPPGKKYPVRVSLLVRPNYRAVVLASNDIQPEAPADGSSRPGTLNTPS
jgi:hypothetical protein